MTAAGSSALATRPTTNGPYLAAAAAYAAGFRGWALTVMTAIAGRESTWNPTALNNNASTGDYSVGLWQINYYGQLLQPRSATFGPPQSLQGNPLQQAEAAFQLAGGNALTGLANWGLASSPADGQVPAPVYSGVKSITGYLPTAAAAAAEVTANPSAATSALAQAGETSSAWGVSGAPGSATATLASTTNAGGCGSKVGGNPAEPNQLFTIPHTSAGITYCQAKAFMGALTLAAGSGIMIVGVAFLVVALGKGAALGGLAGYATSKLGGGSGGAGAIAGGAAGAAEDDHRQMGKIIASRPAVKTADEPANYSGRRGSGGTPRSYTSTSAYGPEF